MKYSINSSGNIVAERDIYSLGGFIPKGSVGAKVANEDQISQDGECWVSAGDISGRPDVRVKDNTYIGDFLGATGMHTDGATEFSGDTLIPGKIIVRNLIADPVNNFFAKDSFIGVSIDALCGPADVATAFAFGQGSYSVNSAAGTLFAYMESTPIPANSCRRSAALRLGKETKIYVPVGLRCQVLWGYYNTTGREAYSGRYTEYTPGLHTISDPVYGIARVQFWKIDGTAMTPADLLATGAKILGHIIDSVNVDIRPEPASGQYVMNNSYLIVKASNFGSGVTQKMTLAGSMYDTTMYTKADIPDCKLYGTFRNVERLEYTKSLPDSHRTAANRDTYISAYDCPLLRIDSTTYDDALAAKGNLVLRRCIVPKAEFQDDIINGNTYEDIDFSCANEDLGFTIAGYTRFISSHKQGIYRLSGGPVSTGFVSHKGNLADTARLFQAAEYIPLDGSIVEQGAYEAGTNIGVPYEEAKVNSNAIVRSYKPVSTASLSLPTVPSGYVLDAIVYLDESFIIRRALANPASIETTYPYAVMQFRRADTSRLNVSDFIALGLSLSMINYGKVPEITGSAYVGAGCTVRGDVQLHGDPYVNRVFDVNLWERGENTMVSQQTWEAGKNLTNQERHFEFKEALPVEAGATVSASSGYFIYAGWMDENKRIISTSGAWASSFTVPANAKYVGLVLKRASSAAATGSVIEDSDISAAGIKYVRAFKKRRYIVNELDRTSPEDILLSVDYWEQGYVDRAVGPTYEALKSASVNYIRLRLPVNTGRGATATQAAGYGRITISLDSLTKCESSDAAIIDGTPLSGAVIRKDPTSSISPAEVPSSRFKIDFTPSPRIMTPYGSSTLFISGPKIRMYDNAVLSRKLNQEGEIVLQGDAVMGYDFNSGSCMCSNGHSDAIIKLP